MPDDCIFCAIVAGDIPATKIDEDDRVVAFMDINPATRGHVLVIPRNHTPNLLEIDEDDLAAVGKMAQRIARRATQADVEAAAGVPVLLGDDPALVPLETLPGRDHYDFPAGQEPPWRWRIESRYPGWSS